MQKVTITDRDGWRKELPLQKSIIYIGSDTANDIVLDSVRGAGVAPRHAQLLTAAAGIGDVRLVNLGQVDILVGMGSDRAISPFSSTVLKDGEPVKVGDFTLVFSGLVAPAPVSAPAASMPTMSMPTSTPAATTPQGATPVSTATPSGSPEPPPIASSMIGLKLVLPESPVTPSQPLEGTITIRNLGKTPAAQFKIQVEGLDPSAYEIGPSPILFPNAEKEIFFRIKHTQRSTPRGGEQKITVRATAPEAYPGESATVVHSVLIQPFYNYTLRWVSTN